MLPQWSLPTGLHSPSVNISGARPMTSHDGCQLETDDSGAYHLSFSPVRGASFTAALMGFSSSLDIIPCCTLPSPWNIRAWGGVLSSTCLGVSTFRVSWGTGKTNSFSVSPFQQRSREATSTLLSSLRTCVCMELVLRMPIVCCTALSLHSLPHTNLPEESKGIKPTLPKRTSQVQEV